MFYSRRGEPAVTPIVRPSERPEEFVLTFISE